MNLEQHLKHSEKMYAIAKVASIIIAIMFIFTYWFVFTTPSTPILNYVMLAVSTFFFIRSIISLVAVKRSNETIKNIIERNKKNQ